MRRLLVLAAVVLTHGCAHSPPPAPERSTARDTLPGFMATMVQVTDPGAAASAWTAYEQSVPELHDEPARDPGDAKLRKLAVSLDAVRQLVAGFAETAPGSFTQVERDLATHFGASPPVEVVFAVLREDAPVRRDGTRLLVNARHPDFAAPGAIRARLAAALGGALHEERHGAPHLTPLTDQLLTEGMGHLASQTLSPQSDPLLLLGLTRAELGKLEARKGLVARELIASFDVASEEEAQRYFNPKLKDPVLPRGAGPYLADLLSRRLVGKLGSARAVFELSPSEWKAAARAVLSEMASSR